MRVCLECSCEREHSPLLKVNTLKPSALHEETSAAIKNVTSAACYADAQLASLSGSVCEMICKVDRLRQARIARYTDVWIYFRQREKQQSGVLGTHL